MKHKSLGIKIFLFCELVVACRILLFEIPISVNKFFGTRITDLSNTDRFQAIIVFVSIFYLVAATAALLGHTFWRQLHYLTTALAAVLTLAFFVILQQQGQPFYSFYYLPIIGSVLTSWVVFFYRENSPEKEKI